MELGHGIGRVLALCLALGASSFIVGVLPLSFNFSARQRSQLSTFGNGLLLGAALGVIIPEGAEALMKTRHEAETSFSSQIALSLLVGFAFMLVTEQFLASNALHSFSSTSTAHEFAAEEYDLRISELDEGQLREPAQLPTAYSNKAFTAYSLTFGLTIHSLADGLALGASSVGQDEDSTLSVVVFLALFIHKIPTALALTSSLISTPLSRLEIRKHVAVFSAATPVGALSSFFVLNILGTRAGSWTGIALLISGGSFLYVATVIQPIAAHSRNEGGSSTEELPKAQRLLFLIGGIFLPLLINALFSHEHG